MQCPEIDFPGCPHGITSTLAGDYIIVGEIHMRFLHVAVLSAFLAVLTSGCGGTSKLSPSVLVSPASSTIGASDTLQVSITVNGSKSTPTGAVVLSSGSYTSASTTLSAGSASITITAGALAFGIDTLTVVYSPDTASSSTYDSAKGTATVSLPTAVSVDQATMGKAVTDQILGMNLAAWYDLVTNQTAVQNALSSAGIKAVRWPGGSWSDIYHWSTNTNCSASSNGTPNGDDTFSNLLKNIVTPGGFDLALTANYGTNAACNGGGDPTEAAAWITQATSLGVTVSHMTVGNEVYGSWEEDMHTTAHDPATYVAAVTGSVGYYNLIKTANSATKVGIVVDADNTVGGWDAKVMAGAKGYYDYVEYHFYPQSPGNESDSNLLSSSAYDAQLLTKNLKIISTELSTWGNAGVPIYVGEMGSVSSKPGKQSESIVQALFAGETLGEMMNNGVSRATWWLAFGGCATQGASGAGNFSSSLYGWQNYGGYSAFSDGNCTAEPAIGTLLPTARAFQLFSHVAVNGEYALTPTVTGDTTDVVAYAATHSAKSATALVLFNMNESSSVPVAISMSGESASSDITEYTYSKALYDESNASSPIWAAPTSSDLGVQSLPLSVTLAPWSMNVFLIK